MIEESTDKQKEELGKAIHAIDRIENVVKNIIIKGEIAE